MNPITITLDRDASATYIALFDYAGPCRTKELAGPVHVDYTPEGNFVGVELLKLPDATTKPGLEHLTHLWVGPMGHAPDGRFAVDSVPAALMALQRFPLVEVQIHGDPEYVDGPVAQLVLGWALCGEPAAVETLSSELRRGSESPSK